MASLAEIRAKLQEQASKNFGTGSSDRSIYPHWNIAEGESCLIRFLPDGDSTNIFFWKERAMIKLPFSGVRGGESKTVFVQVPCMEMWGETCPVLTEVRPWFKDKSLEELGRKYWKKRSYIMQGFVRENPIDKDETPENPIRRFVMSPQLANVIKSALLDPELEEMPTDYERGLDFRVSKGSKGGYADYGTSKWSRRESALTEQERQAIERFGLFNLNDFMPKKPTAVELRAIKEMFEASVDGQAYDPERWGAYYKPSGMGGDWNDSATESKPNSAPAKPTAPAQPAADQDNPPFDADPDPEPAPVAPATAKTANRAEDILAMIRSRQQKS